jgi:hypothetical protein
MSVNLCVGLQNFNINKAKSIINMETTMNKTFTEKVVDTLRKAATELEEYQVQAALGKAEAKDKFEEVKKNFNLFMNDSKTQIRVGEDKLEELHTKFDELKVQLSLGKAETIDAFQMQKKNLLDTLHNIQVSIKTNKAYKKSYAFVMIEIDKFKVQLEALEHRFENKAGATETSFEKGKQDFDRFVDGLKSRLSQKEDTNWEHFQGEISEAFSHFKKAFTRS